MQNLLAEFSGLNGYSCDKLIWTADQSNVFSVNSMYQWFDRSLRNAVDVPNFLWKNVTPMRVKFFGWLVWNGRIKSGDLLLKFGVLDDVADIRCGFCESEIESVDHVFLHCMYVHKVWTDCLKWWGMIWVTPKSVCDLLIWWQSFKFKKRKKLFWEAIPMTILWAVWKRRNDLKFNKVIPDWYGLVDSVKYRVVYWVKLKADMKEYSIDNIKIMW